VKGDACEVRLKRDSDCRSDGQHPTTISLSFREGVSYVPKVERHFGTCVS